MNMWTFVQLLLVGIMLAAGATGCKREPDLALRELIRLKEYDIKEGLDVEEQRVESALSKWQNGRLDREPIMLSALLAKTIGRETKGLTFFTFDEDKDIVGFGIFEEYTDVNGLRTTLTEEYKTTGNGPYPPDEAVQGFAFQVQIRDAGQHKDMQQWNEYLEAKSRDVNGGQDLAPAGETSPVRPPIWISIPEPNHVYVYVYVYDQQGHKSETIRVRNSIPQDE